MLNKMNKRQVNDLSSAYKKELIYLAETIQNLKYKRFS